MRNFAKFKDFFHIFIKNIKLIWNLRKFETILHIFWECPVVEQFRAEIRTWLNGVYGMEINIVCPNFILGLPSKKDSTLNMILTIWKSYIYKQKLKNCRLSLIGYKKVLIYYYNLEHYLYKKNLKEDHFQRRWEYFHRHLGNNLQV